MFSDKAAVTQKANKLMETGRFTIAEIADKLDTTEGEVKRFLGGFRMPNGARYLEKMEAFLDELGEGTNANDFRFFETAPSRTLNSIIDIAQKFKEIVLAVGSSGLGKTCCLLERGKRDRNVVLLQAEIGWSPHVLVRQIFAKLLHETAGTANMASMNERVKDALKEDHLTIVVDEVDLLEFRAIEVLRRYHDICKIGVVLCGLPRVISTIRSRGHGEYEQLLSRISCVAEIKGLADEDFETFVKAALPTSDGLWRCFKENARGNARRLDFLIKRSLRIAEINHCEVTRAVVENAAKMLLD